MGRSKYPLQICASTTNPIQSFYPDCRLRYGVRRGKDRANPLPLLVRPSLLSTVLPLKHLPSSQRDITPTNDALLLASQALLTGTQYGLALVAGTGSVILGLEIPLVCAEQDGSKGARKPIVRCRKGGNGHLLGDHGSGRSVVSFNL